MFRQNRLSPLKSRRDYTAEISFIEQKIPKRIQVNTFPLYSGEVEASLSTKGYKVRAITNKFVVNEFWQTLNKSPQQLQKFITFFSKKPVEEIGFFLQKEWFKSRDPLIRSALFYILQNSSTECLASKGEVKPFNIEVTSLLRRWNSSLFSVNFLDIGDESIIEELPTSDGMFYFNGSRVTNEFLEDSSCGIDETNISNKEILSLMFTNYEPWMCSFSPSQALIDHVSNRANIYFLDHNGEQTDKAQAFRCIVTNV